MRLAVICNPTTVDDREELQIEVKRRWPHDDVLWFETVPADPGAGQTRRALDEGVDVVLVAGGDGTVAQAVGVLAETQVALALLPVGTGNLLARNLGLPLDLGEALDRAAGSGRDHIDVLQADGRCFTVMAGLGFDATMMRETDDAGKTRFGWLAYLGGGFRALRRTPRRRYAISVDGRPHVRITALAVMIGNVGQLQGGMDVLPDADPRDGRPGRHRARPAYLARHSRARRADSSRAPANQSSNDDVPRPHGDGKRGQARSCGIRRRLRRRNQRAHRDRVTRGAPAVHPLGALANAIAQRTAVGVVDQPVQWHSPWTVPPRETLRYVRSKPARRSIPRTTAVIPRLQRLGASAHQVERFERIDHLLAGALVEVEMLAPQSQAKRRGRRLVPDRPSPRDPAARARPRSDQARHRTFRCHVSTSAG